MTEFTFSSTAGHNSAFTKMCSAKNYLEKFQKNYQEKPKKFFQKSNASYIYFSKNFS